MRKKKTLKNTRVSRNIHQLDIFHSGKANRQIFQKKNLKRFIKKHISLFKNIPKRYNYYVFGAIFGVSIYMIFFSSFFSIKEIHIYRKDNLSSIEQAYRSVNIFRSKKIYSIESKEISTRLQKSQKSLKYISIQRKLPDSLEIYLESYKPLFVSGEKVILENGSMLEGDGIMKETLPKLALADTGKSNTTLNYKNLQNIQNIGAELTENIQDFQISHRIYFPAQEEVIFVTDQGIFLIFDVGENPRHQTEKLGLYINNLQDTPFSDYVYLDLRISGKVFTCGKESANVCNNNMKKLYGETPFKPLKDPASSESPQ